MKITLNSSSQTIAAALGAAERDLFFRQRQEREKSPVGHAAKLPTSLPAASGNDQNEEGSVPGQ